MLTINELPSEFGLPEGNYRLRRAGVNETFFDCRFEDGENVEPVTGRTVARLAQAWGTEVTIEPWDEETAMAVLEHIEARGNDRRTDEVAACCQELFMPEPEPDDEDEDEDDEEQGADIDGDAHESDDAGAGESDGEEDDDEDESAPVTSESTEGAPPSESDADAPVAGGGDSAEAVADAESKRDEQLGLLGDQPADPAAKPELHGENLDGMDKPELKELATRLEVRFDGRWGEDRFRDAIRAHFAPPPSE